MIKYLMISFLAIGFVFLYTYSYSQSTTDTNKTLINSASNTDTLKNEIKELRTQIKILEESRESYSDNIATISYVATALVTFVFLAVGLGIPWYLKWRFNKRINKSTKQIEEKFADKINEQEKGYNEIITEQAKKFDDKIKEQNNNYHAKMVELYGKFDEKIDILEKKNKETEIRLIYYQKQSEMDLNFSNSIYSKTPHIQVVYILKTWECEIEKNEIAKNGVEGMYSSEIDKNHYIERIRVRLDWWKKYEKKDLHLRQEEIEEYKKLYQSSLEIIKPTLTKKELEEVEELIGQKFE